MRLFFKPKVTCTPTQNLWFVYFLNVQTSKQHSKKIGSWGREVAAGGAYHHGTTGTMVNPALSLSMLRASFQLLAVVGS